MKRTVAIDMVPIRPGKGGTGSGIWTVVRELVNHMDQLDDFQGLEIICLINREQQPAFSNLRKIRCVVFPNLGKNTALRLLWTHLFLPLWCFFRRIDVLHKPATETPLFCSARRVTTVHDFFHEFMQEQGGGAGLAGFYFRWMSAVCFRKSRAVITVSDTTRDEARRRFPRSRAVETTVYNGSFSSDESLAVRETNKPFTLLCVAKLMPYKGQMEALSALAVLFEKQPELRERVRMILHGFSNDEAYVQRLGREARREIFRGAVEFHAYSLGKTVDDIYRDVDALLFLSQYEGFGLPVVEAQARGVPVVCSDLAVLREVGGNGARYVSRGNASEIADVLLSLIRHESGWEQQIDAGLKNAKRFDWRVAAQKTMAVYQKVLS